MLPISEERFSPEIRNDNALEHLHRYGWAFSWLKPEDSVIDIASGEGYGTNILAGIAHHTLGVDLSPECIAHAQERYCGTRLAFSEGDIREIPTDNHVFDVAVSFETIEHVDEPESALDELRRVVKPEGLVIVSTPDKLEYSDKPGHRNRFHKREMYRDEFEDALRSRFKHVALFGQRIVRGSMIYPAGPLPDMFSLTRWDGRKLVSNRTLHAPVYWIAVASNGGRISFAPAGFHQET